MMTTSINYTLDVGFHSDSMYKSYGEITAPEVKKKQEILNFLFWELSFNDLLSDGSCAAGSRFQWNTP